VSGPRHPDVFSVMQLSEYSPFLFASQAGWDWVGPCESVWVDGEGGGATTDPDGWQYRTRAPASVMAGEHDWDHKQGKRHLVRRR
jgi:hypothetical protein